MGELQAGAGFPDNEQGVMTEEIPFFKVGDMAQPGNAREMVEAQHFVSPATARRLRARVFPANTIVFAKVGAALRLNRRRLLLRPSCMDNNMMGFVPTECDPTWALFWLSCLDLDALANPGAVPSVNEGQMRDVPVVAPPLAEQRAIATFLDRETAMIDALVTKKERLIELLQEKRAALISRAVTKGLNPTVPMRDSGVQWLGEIPAHWDAKRLVRLSDEDVPIVYGILLPGPRLEEGVPYIGAGDVANGHLRIDELPRTTPEIASEYPRSRVRPGDIVYAIRGSFGAVQVVPTALAGVNLSRDAARIAPRRDVVGRWLCWALRSETSREQYRFHALGAAITGVNIRDLKRVILPCPPVAEQNAIADFLDRETESFDRLIVRVRDGIARTKELRSALISAAVTGKIDVRDAQ